MNRLVTVVTPTWGRPYTLLRRAIPSVQAQTYWPLQHIIVTDGVNENLNTLLRAAGYLETTHERRLVQLGRNWTSYSGDDSYGVVPRMVGAFLAAGDYICYLDDDDEYLPHHVSNMAAALDAGADLVCCRWYSPDGDIEGSPPPRVTQTGTGMFMHKAHLLRHSSWQIEGRECDGKLAERWVAAGFQWAFLEEPTVVYHGANFGVPEQQ